MNFEMKLPSLGESISEATILKWRKKPGDAVTKDEPLLEISTDKVDSEIPSPVSGVLIELKAAEGQTISMKSVVAIIDTESKPAVLPQVSTPPIERTSPTPSKPSKPKLKSPLADDITQSGVGVAAIRGAAPQAAELQKLSPLVRNIVAKEGLTQEDLAAIQGTGPQGRLTKEDILDYLKQRESEESDTDGYNAAGLLIEPFDNMRKKIAEHMVRSKATSPHVYTVAEVDMTNIAKWRANNQDSFLKKEGFKLTFTPFFVEAAAKALVQYPRVNASVDGDNLVMKRNINVGCAVALGTSGLIVPVLKNADKLNLVGLAHALNDVASRAKVKKLLPDDTQDGTFTITNAGIFGSILSYPIIAQPQLAILGIGAIKKRPVVVEDMIAIRDIVYLTLSYDHRVIDGSLGGSFLSAIAKYLETWDVEKPLYT